MPTERTPQLFEEDIFKIIIPLTAQATEQATEQAERTKKILDFCKTEKTTSEIMNHLGLTHREHFRADILQPLINKRLLFLTIPDKPSSPIDPKLKESGWGVIDGTKINRNFPITLGRIQPGNIRASPIRTDYVLSYKGRKLAAIEAKSAME